jgi:hypothetical protein
MTMPGRTDSSRCGASKLSRVHGDSPDETLKNPLPMVETSSMTALPLASPTLAPRLLTGGVPLTLLIDLLDPEGMRIALAAELLAQDVALAPAPPLRQTRVRIA